ncbi:MAG: response regulator [Actinomycetota bacterium]|nr:response regulator [Actinomycetota bacterium]
MTAARVLVVDDDPAVRQMLELALVFEGFEILTAADGLEALGRALQARPDAILLDVMMPRMGGLEAAQALRGDPRTTATPIILLTARAGEEDLWLGWQAGVDSYLVKPIDLDSLVMEIRRVISTTAVA